MSQSYRNPAPSGKRPPAQQDRLNEIEKSIYESCESALAVVASTFPSDAAPVLRAIGRVCEQVTRSLPAQFYTRLSKCTESEYATDIDVLNALRELQTHVEDFAQEHHDLSTKPSRKASTVNGRRIVSTCAADVVPKPADWVWQGRLPAGTLVVLDGDPGLGKSTFAVDVIAKVTTGIPFPGDVRTPRDPANAIIISYEDSESVIASRLKAALADLKRVQIVEGVVDKDRLENLFSIPENLLEIESMIMETNSTLVVIDPIMAAFSGKIDTHSDQSVRRALSPLTQMARRTGVCVLALRHLTKKEGSKAIHREGGSIAITAAARVGMLLGNDPRNPDQRVLAVTKNNLSKMPESYAFRLTNDPAYQCAAIEWIGTSSYSADELVQPGRIGALEHAVEFLRHALSGGPRYVEDIKREAANAHIKWPTILRAKTELKVKSKHPDFGGPWQWCLLEDDQIPRHEVDHLRENMGNSAENTEGDQPPSVEADHLRDNMRNLDEIAEGDQADTRA